MPQSFHRSRSCFRASGCHFGSPSGTETVEVATVVIGIVGTGLESNVYSRLSNEIPAGPGLATPAKENFVR